MVACKIIEDLKTFWFSLWFNSDFDDEIEESLIFFCDYFTSQLFVNTLSHHHK